ncbi:MAG TPA: hypothetical protein VFN67_36315 [Polyangiales bacterium]|nr:hypothetical protein [Polyangiales bacterium]
MTPERLNSWIYRPVTASKVLILSHEPTIGQSSTIAQWSREDVELLREQNGSQGDEVLQCAREQMENAGERDTQKFVLSWFGDKSPNALRSTVLKLQPDESALAVGQVAAANGGGDLAQTLPFFLNHISQTQRATIGSIGVLLAAHERTAAMQQRIIDSQLALIEKLLETNGGRADTSEVSEAKARVLEKLTSVLPDVVSAGLHLAASKLAPPTAAPKQQPPPPQLTADQRKAAARAALLELEPAEITELVSEDDHEHNSGATA